MTHRREIDGLRALAVLPVILYHAGAALLPGGFLGVDVFFVISGYLITLLILQDLERGAFSLKAFYARRARRILPALFTVVLVTIPLAFAILLPEQYAWFSKSLLAVLGFGSNFLFWRETGYYGPEASEKPLLHTWSLGVEEQFYFLMPLALMLLWRYARNHLGVLMLLATAISLALCEMASRYFPAAAFFLLPTRAWELLIGAFCAWAQLRRPSSANNGLACFGLLLVLGSFFLMHHEMRLPSLWALPVVLGTALLLRYAQLGSAIAQLLSLRPLTAIGRISYSAYLWHFPPLALARTLSIPTDTPQFMAMLIVGTLTLAYLSWRFIEEPFRRPSHAKYVSSRRAWQWLVVSVLVIVGTGVHGVVTQGRIAEWKQLASTGQVRAYELLKAANAESPYYDNGDCVFNISAIGAKESQRLVDCGYRYGFGIAVIGDSHAINLFNMMRESELRLPFMVGIARGACRPHTPAATCFYDDFTALLTAHPRMFHTILYHQAGFYLLKDRFGKPVERNDMVGVPMDRPWPEFALNTAYVEAVRDYLEPLVTQARVIWVGPHVSPHFTPSAIVRHGCDKPFALRPNQREVYALYDREIADVLRGSAVRYRAQNDALDFDITQDFMNCDVTYFRDGDHYSSAGEKRFAKRVTLNYLTETP